MAKAIQPTPEHQKALKWCLKNEIKVSQHPTLKGLRVEINNRGTRILSPETYSKTQANNKCWELYLYLYKKYY